MLQRCLCYICPFVILLFSVENVLFTEILTQFEFPKKLGLSLSKWLLTLCKVKVRLGCFQMVRVNKKLQHFNYVSCRKYTGPHSYLHQYPHPQIQPHYVTTCIPISIYIIIAGKIKFFGFTEKYN